MSSDFRKLAFDCIDTSPDNSSMEKTGCETTGYRSKSQLVCMATHVQKYLDQGMSALKPIRMSEDNMSLTRQFD